MEGVDWSQIRRRERAVCLRDRSVREQPGVASIDAGLPAQLRSEADRVEDRPGVSFVEKIGIVEGIGAVGRVVVCGSVEGSVGRVYCPRERSVARINVLIELFVIREVCRVS